MTEAPNQHSITVTVITDHENLTELQLLKLDALLATKAYDFTVLIRKEIREHLEIEAAAFIDIK